MKKKIYLVSQNHNNDWDTYDSMVVCAESEADAIEVSYESLGGKRCYLNGCDDDWISYDSRHLIQVQYIGLADKGIERGSILQSFNAS